MSLPTTTEPSAAPNVQVQAAAPPTASSWSRQLKERLERLDKATSAPVDLYPGTPAYNAARKLEKTIEATWRAYLVELVRNDLAAGVVGGRRKHYWEKNECLIVYELVEGSRLEEFPSSDVGKREEYLACTVRDALYIKVPQFSSSFTFPWPSPTNPDAKLPNETEGDPAVVLDKVDIKLRAASLATPPQSPPSRDEETLAVMPRSIQQRHTVSCAPHQSHVPDNSIVAHVLHPEADPSRNQPHQSDSDKVTPAPSVVLTAPAHHTLRSVSAPGSPIAPPSALTSALIGVGTAHALGLSLPRVQTSDSSIEERGKGPLPIVSITSQPSHATMVNGEGVDGGLGLSIGDEVVPQSPLDQTNDGEHDDHEVATIQRARRASVATATFKTLNPVVGLDAEIERRSRPSSPMIAEIPAPELVYYGSGANSEEEEDEDDGMPVETFKSLNPHVSLEAEIVRRSCPSSPVPAVFLTPQNEEEDGPIETFKSLNPAVSLDAEILRRSRTPSPVPRFKELNEELSLEKEIAKRAASRPASPNPFPAEDSERFANADEVEDGLRPVSMPNKSLVRATLLLPLILGLRVMNVFNPFAYFYLVRSRSRHTYPPEPYPKIPRSLLRMVVPAFIWRWAGKDPSYNLQLVGLGKGVNTIGTRYDSSGAALPSNST